MRARGVNENRAEPAASALHPENTEILSQAKNRTNAPEGQVRLNGESRRSLDDLPRDEDKAPAYVHDPGIKLPEDFISAYVDYAFGTELPAEAHEGVAISLIAALLNTKGMRVMNGAIPYTFDWWHVLVSGSGSGRSTMLGISRELLKEANIKLENRDLWGSFPAMKQSMAENPRYGLMAFGEFRTLFELLSQPGFTAAKVFITDLYDEQALPHDTRHKVNLNDKGEPIGTTNIQFTEAPRTNFITTSSTAWFEGTLKKHDTLGGFFPRWFVQYTDRDRVVPTPPRRDKEKLKPLVKLLHRINQMEPKAFDISTDPVVMAAHEKWFRENEAEFSAQGQQEIAKAFWNRHRGHALKLAVVFEVSRTQRAIITEDSLRRAIEFLKPVRANLFKLISTGMSHEGKEEQETIEAIIECGAKGMPKEVLSRRTRKSSQTRERIIKLCETGDCWLAEVGNGGRPGQWLISKKFDVEAAKQAHGEVTRFQVIENPECYLHKKLVGR